ncbi:MAG: type VI secretion system baseplate subunit TssF [Desulfatitalea sp.]|nr:type VI secretion system baseplate subunit TssF [Desulfatitalea sp.]NNK02251.1 type VI secretion system baseplate subunit TssF [Desulfatitalea sp.]
MFNQYFQEELANLRDLGAEYSRLHPAVAPMLSGMSTDPDTERLLEGVAFLTALMRQRLDDDFPEIIQELFQLIWPHYLRPLPAATIVAFMPKANLKQQVRVPKGTQIASAPVDGTPCLFQTCFDVQVHPLRIENAVLAESAGRPPAVRLMLSLDDIKLGEWQADTLRLHIAGNAEQAADIYLLLLRYLDHIVLTSPAGGEACRLTGDHLKPVGFADDENLIPYPGQSFPGYRIIQEYFLLPEKFLFLDLTGIDKWRRRPESSQLEIRFVLKTLPFAPPRVRTHNFALAATPAINLFSHDADPIRLDHMKSEYFIRPSGGNDRHFQVYDVQNVTGFLQGTAQERNYAPFELFSPDPEADPTYHVNIRQSPVRQGYDFFLSVAYPPGSGSPPPETLSIALQCTNGSLPEGLQVGDIAFATSTTPEFIEFKNLRPPTATVVPAPGKNLHWRLLSHLCLNYRTLADVENLQALLNLYNFEENRDRPAFLANQKRIAGIQKVETKTSDRLVDRVIMRGRDIHMQVRQDHYAGLGDLFLFGSVLDHFLGLYASMNTFTRLTIKEVLKGEVYQWPARIGEHPLI